ncbi:MAG: UDP-N-acetylmuramate dehydrogenase [bacterium]|nr:UDP-N-acetylmuramate dehydrogenase [bacterium]
MINVLENIPLSSYTTLGIGGPAKYFVEARSVEELKEASTFAKEKSLEILTISGGSNLLVNDPGFPGLVIKLDLTGIKLSGETVVASAGSTLNELVDFANNNSLAGAEKLAGIPGSIGGAVYGNAGAYGQTVSDKLVGVNILQDGEVKSLSKEECAFEYRDSGFKRMKNTIILEAEFRFGKGDSEELIKVSVETIEKRKEKYKPGIKTPGSFFKNVLIENLPVDMQKDMPKDYYGKVPAWWFLEQVGAKDARLGQVHIADFHANLFVNEGNGTAKDFFDLAKEYKEKVKEKFGIDLEPEVQLIGFQEEM